MDGGKPYKTRRRVAGAGHTALVLAFLTLSVLAQGKPASASADTRSCVQEGLRGSGVTDKCWAMIWSELIRAAQMVGDEWKVQRDLSGPRIGKQCADADSTATCLAKLDAIAGWTADEARRAAEENAPRARQCFLYRTEALRQARAANDYERVGLLERDEPCCEEMERSYQRMYQEYGRRVDVFPEPGINHSWAKGCPEPPPTPRTFTKGTGWTNRWRNWTGYAIGRGGTAVDLFFDLLIFGLLAWVIVSPLIFLYWHLAPRRRDRFKSQHGNVVAVIQVGTFLSCVLVLSLGIRSLLIFLPAWWGWYEEGEFVQARQWIAFVLGTLATFFLTHIYAKAEKVWEENEKQRRDADQAPK